MLLSVQSGDEKEKIFEDEERDKLVKYLSELTKKLSLRLKNKSTRCRYSEHAINISMSLYLRSKSAYHFVRDNTPTPLPHPRRLRDRLSKLRPIEGIDPKSLVLLKEVINSKKYKLKGHLMMDEIKLKNGLMWNSMNGIVTGFIKDELNVKDLMLYILGMSKKKRQQTTNCICQSIEVSLYTR